MSTTAPIVATVAPTAMALFFPNISVLLPFVAICCCLGAACVRVDTPPHRGTSASACASPGRFVLELGARWTGRGESRAGGGVPGASLNRDGACEGLARVSRIQFPSKLGWPEPRCLGFRKPVRGRAGDFIAVDTPRALDVAGSALQLRLRNSYPVSFRRSRRGVFRPRRCFFAFGPVPEPARDEPHDGSCQKQAQDERFVQVTQDVAAEGDLALVDADDGGGRPERQVRRLIGVALGHVRDLAALVDDLDDAVRYDQGSVSGAVIEGDDLPYV